uniref:CATSPERG beta-propeller domain-containing protein n=1 Tax=Nannospalax galili TaxID=1026970 RepID=A0A8C6RYX3_NANGA
MVCWPAMSPASPVWPREPVQWALWVLLVLLLVPWRSWAVENVQRCSWRVVLNKFEKKYLGFPYYLKVDFSCMGKLSIDSCWVGSYYCPLAVFSATIHDAISTESTLFIRQNQLVYYFTGTYSTLFERSHSSSNWVRVLPSECIKKLCPVFLNGNGSEYVLALTTGKNEGYVHLGTITDGIVSFKMVPESWSVCEKLMGTHLSGVWCERVGGLW